MADLLIKDMLFPTRCEDCNFHDENVGGFIGCRVKRLLISRKRGQDKPSWCPLVEVPKSVDVVPVRRGRWIENDNGTFSCSECQAWIPYEQRYYARYCLHCGSRMEVEQDD